jgi:hypothetical protein
MSDRDRKTRKSDILKGEELSDADSSADIGSDIDDEDINTEDDDYTIEDFEPEEESTEPAEESKNSNIIRFKGRDGDMPEGMVRRRKSRASLYIFIVIAVLIVGSIIAFNAVMSHISFSAYDTVMTKERRDTSSSRYLSYQGDLLKYDGDGVTITDSRGQVIFNASYDMDEPDIDMCGKYFVIYDRGGKICMTYDGKNAGKEIRTDYEIEEAHVAANGVTAVMVELAASDKIMVYDPFSSNKLLAEIPSNVDEGYPINMDISPDAQSIAVSFINIASGKTESRIVFYNFSNVGRNSGNVVGVMDYNDKVVDALFFISSDRLAAADEHNITVYNDMKSPSRQFTIKADTDIRSIFANDKFVGMVTSDKKGGSGCHVLSYTINGRKVMDKKYKVMYNDLSLYEDELIFTSSEDVHIIRMNGTEKFTARFEDGTDYIIPGNGPTRLFHIGPNKIELLKLKP